MEYCYDILINLNENSAYNFYEWEDYDPIELIKKIPIFRVDSKILKDFYLYNIKVSNDFLNTLSDKTILKNNKINKTLKYACLLCDTKNTLVVEFDEEGNLINRSTLLLEDDANIIEFIYNYKETKINYEKKDLINYKNILRQEEIIKKVIKTEINTLLANKNFLKLKYLFNEWFGYEESDFRKIKNIMFEDLDYKINLITQKIYNLIILSYSKS